jgi:hypothetical protein
MRPLNRPMFKSGGPIKEGIMSGMQDRPGYSVAGRVGSFLFNTVPKMFKSQPSVVGSGSGIAGKYVPAPLTRMEKIKQFFQTAPAGKFAAGTTEGKLIGNLISGSGVVPRVIKGTVKTAAKSPLATGTILYYGGGALLPDGTPDPTDPKNIKPAGERGKSGAPGGGDPNMFLTPKEKKLSKDQKDKITKDRIEANRERYYKLMGIDKMQKGAAYDSLIDASKIIQQEGGDLRGAIKSGSLQSQIIDAISKNLDKSTDLKKQIDAAILKGEITKDIKAADPAAKLAAELTKKRIELADKTLEGGDLSEALLAAYNKQGVFPAGNQLAGFARAKGIDVDGVEDTQEVKKWMKDNKSDEEGYISSLVKEGKVPDGTYVINDRIFTVNGEDITSVV